MAKKCIDQFVVVWAPKMNLSELSHVKQTNPAVIGLARLGDGRGLRVHAEQAQAIHQVLRPEVDRQAIIKALKQAGWHVKALQPTQSVPGRGSMWILQSVDAPPQMIFHMAHGEVVVSKHKQAENVKPIWSPLLAPSAR